MGKRHHHHTPRRHLPRSRRAAPGTPPGTVVPTLGAHPSSVRVIRYGPDELEENPLESVADLSRHRGQHGVTWIDVSGVGDSEWIHAIGEQFGLHALALEDVVHPHQRPKAEDYGDNLYVVVRMPSLIGDELDLEQVSMFLGDGFVITFQERPGDCLEPVRERIRSGRGRIRTRGPDYLAYAILDAIVDHFFPILDVYTIATEHIETQVLDAPASLRGSDFQGLRHDLLALRRALWPLRETLGVLTRGEVERLSDETRLYLRDCHDHAAQLMDTMDSLRDLLANLADLQLSSLSHRMNDTMRVLTLIATVFIPLSFIASLYGMNFDRDSSAWNMPELGWRFGYPLALALMASVGLGFLWYFRRKGWLGGGHEPPPHDAP